jgi:hypothetical protein
VLLLQKNDAIFNHLKKIKTELFVRKFDPVLVESCLVGMFGTKGWDVLVQFISKRLSAKKQESFDLSCFFADAQDWNRTSTDRSTRPSNVRVYQFRHLGINKISKTICFGWC